jgi:hypothetical protein
MIKISTVLEELYELKGVNCSIKNNLMESSLKGKWDASEGVVKCNFERACGAL